MLGRWPPSRIGLVAFSRRNGAVARRVKCNILRSESSLSTPSSKPPDSREFLRSSWRKPAAVGAAIVLTLCALYLAHGTKHQQNSFTTYKLVARQPVSSTSSIFHLRPNEPNENWNLFREAWKQGVWNVHFKQPQLQIIRAYTPLPPHASDSGASQELRFLIREDEHGEVSSYLHRLPLGSSIELRGPNLEFQIARDVNQVIFVAGGTGIAPALQVAQAMFAGDANESRRAVSTPANRKLHIMWANRRREDCQGGKSDSKENHSHHGSESLLNRLFQNFQTPPPSVAENKGAKDKTGLIVEELERLKKAYPGQVTVDYFVDEESTWISEEAIRSRLMASIENNVLRDSSGSLEQRHILISGPEGFISSLAGPKQWNQGQEEQGPVTNILGRIVSREALNVTVWKI